VDWIRLTQDDEEWQAFFEYQRRFGLSGRASWRWLVTFIPVITRLIRFVSNL
jgi:hypothetical protein